MRQILTRYFLLNKRLFKKYSFLLILCIVPLLVWSMRLASDEESSIFKIALCMENPDDELSAQVVEKLMSSQGVMRYIMCETQQEARELLNNYEVDTIWIFPDNLRERLRESAHSKRIKSVVTVVDRWESVSLIFANEVLCSALYPDFSYEVYKDFVRNDLELNDISDDELKSAYEATSVEGSLFQMGYPDGEAAVEEISYLLAPIRGILSIWLVLCGFAASMYFMQDEQNGTFSGMPVKHKLTMAFGSHAVLLADATVVLLIACKAAGVFTLWQRELMCAFLFACCTMAFCNLIRLIAKKPERLGSVIPMMLMGMLVLCPVFLNVKGFKMLQFMLPPYYYLKSIHSTFYLYGMMIYTVVLVALCVIVFHWQNRQGGK